MINSGLLYRFLKTTKSIRLGKVNTKEDFKCLVSQFSNGTSKKKCSDVDKETAQGSSGCGLRLG